MRVKLQSTLLILHLSLGVKSGKIVQADFNHCVAITYTLFQKIHLPGLNKLPLIQSNHQIRANA
jgi:hypothetical protein